MKRFGKLVVVGVLSASMLVGCSSERDDLISKGKSAYGIGDYQTAYQALSSAKALEGFDKKEENLKTIYDESLVNVFEVLKENGDSEYNSSNFEEAIKIYTQAQSVFATDVYVNTQLSNAKFMLDNQMKFDKYGDFVVEVLNESNEILREFSKNLDSFKVGVISEKEFVVSVKGLVPLSNEIVAKIDEAFYSIDETLIPIHQKLIDLVDFQHRTLLDAVDIKDFFDPVEDLRNNYLTIKKDQTTLVMDMKNYANENTLKFNITPEGSKESSEEVEVEPSTQPETEQPAS